MAGEVAESDRVHPITLPGGSALAVLHRGPYAELGEAYRAAEKWMAENDWTPTGAPVGGVPRRAGRCGAAHDRARAGPPGLTDRLPSDRLPAGPLPGIVGDLGSPEGCRSQIRLRAVTVRIRPARTSDVRAIRRLVDLYSPADPAVQGDGHPLRGRPGLPCRRAAAGGRRVRCPARDLGGPRRAAHARRGPRPVGLGIGRILVDSLLDRARALGVARVFCLTFEAGFFAGSDSSRSRGPRSRPEVYRAAAAVLRRGRGRVAGPRAGQAQHPRQPPDAAHPLSSPGGGTRPARQPSIRFPFLDPLSIIRKHVVGTEAIRRGAAALAGRR